MPCSLGCARKELSHKMWGSVCGGDIPFPTQRRAQGLSGASTCAWSNPQLLLQLRLRGKPLLAQRPHLCAGNCSFLACPSPS